MSTTRQQDCDFLDTLFPGPDSLLETAIAWIKSNLTPDQVFDDNDIARYASHNIDIDETYTEANILGHVSNEYSPEEVFEESELAAWAEANGYVKA